MKRVFQSYRIFVPLVYRLIMFLALPVLAIGMEFMGNLIKMDLGALHTSVFTLAVIFADSWVMNGICDRKSISLDFVKSSKYGHYVMKAAVLSEMGSRLLLCLVVFTITGLIGSYPILSICMGLVCFAMGNIGVTITRHFDNIQVMMIIACIFAGLASAATSVFYFIPVGISIAATVAFAVVAFALCGWYTIKRVEGTYYDSRS